MKKVQALAYAHDAAARCIEHFLADDEWLTERFSEEEAAQVHEALKELRSRHVRSARQLPAPFTKTFDGIEPKRPTVEGVLNEIDEGEREETCRKTSL
jgi:hypothetical protein